jgi:ribose transport system substrate-binding protein
MLRRHLPVLLATAFAASGTAAQQRRGFRIGYAAGALGDPVQAIEADLVNAAAKKAGLAMLPAADANGSATRQANDIRRLIAAGARGIIAVPAEGSGLSVALDAAVERNVPVVALNAAPAGGRVAMIVRADDAGMGQIAGRLTGALLGGRGAVLSLAGSGVQDRDRGDGFAACIRAQFDDITLIEQPVGNRTDAAAATRGVLAQMPDLAAIFLPGDAAMLPGVLRALQQAGRLSPVGAPGHVVLVGIDGSKLALQRIRAGTMDAAISLPLDLLVACAMRYLEAAVAGQHFQPGPTDHDSRIVDDEGNLADLLPAPIVTRVNAASPALWGNKIKA